MSRLLRAPEPAQERPQPLLASLQPLPSAPSGLRQPLRSRSLTADRRASPGSVS
jgi:hypothetical protein